MDMRDAPFRPAREYDLTLTEDSTMLRDMDDKGGIRELKDIDYRSQFDRKWCEVTPEQQTAIDADCGGI
jgi:hypothetical protein